MTQAPRVMISSTFYDLKQVRADLVSFLVEQVGFTPLLSELPSFPVDPDADTIENCKRRVEEDADLLILIVGGRYGFADKVSEKSITNIEYLTAKAKGIPIIAFVQKDVLAVLPVYKSNPKADFGSVVEDSRVFDFIIQLREEDGVWCYEFEYAQQILATLRSRFAHLTYEGITFSSKASQLPASVLHALTGRALRVAVERPPGWEYRLFASVLGSELASRREQRRRHQLSLSFGRFTSVVEGRYEAWLTQRMDEFRALLDGFDTIINKDYAEAIGPPGSPGDPELLVFAARSLGQLYEEAMEWSLRWGRTTCDPLFDKVKAIIPRVAEEVVSKIEQFQAHLETTLNGMDEALARGEKAQANIFIELDLQGTEELTEAFHEIESQVKARGK